MAGLVPLIILVVIGVAVWLRPWPFFEELDEERPADGQIPEWVAARGFVKWVENQARARGLSVRGVTRPVQIECPACHKTSNYFVYPDELCERCWRATLKPVNTPVKSDHA